MPLVPWRFHLTFRFNFDSMDRLWLYSSLSVSSNPLKLGAVLRAAVVARQSVIARRDMSEVLQPVEGALDEPSARRPDTRDPGCRSEGC